jgi:predicted dehydrogenase
MINLGIIGYGYWGPNLVRNFNQTLNCIVKSVADARPARLELLAKNYPAIKGVADAKTIIRDTSIDAVIIATPVFTHFQLAKEALLQGKHVLLEKPMASTVAEAQELIDIALQKKRVIMVDHTFLYTGAVQKIKELIDQGTIGSIQYFDSTRINLGLFQPDINVLWDLAPHDISILRFLVKEKPLSINATGISHTNNQIENIAYMTLNYASDFIAHFNCSWSSPVKVRQTLIGGDAKMIVYNDLEPSEKIRIYDTGYIHKTDEHKNQVLVDYRTGDVYIPKISVQEALSGMAKDFIDSIADNREPISNGLHGIEVIKILEAAQHSIKSKGKEIIIN